jgi:hypothetical protein
MMKRYLSIYCGYSESSIKQVIRLSAKENLIDNVEAWFKFHESRNIASRTYDENVANKVYEVAKIFKPEAIKLLKNLTSKTACHH